MGRAPLAESAYCRESIEPWRHLKDPVRSREAPVFTLMALSHWIGDIHQPLHISFADGRGGNGIDVKLRGKCGTLGDRPDNLHAVWGKCLLQAGLFERVRKRADFKVSRDPNTITYRAVDTLQANTSLTEEKSLVGDEPWKWAAEPDSAVVAVGQLGAPVSVVLVYSY